MTGFHAKSLARWNKRGGAGNIDAAWKAKKRKKTGLVQRTLEANRRQLKKLAKTADVKQKTDQVGSDTQTPPWCGQSFTFQPNNIGVDVGGTKCVVQPLYLNRGTANNEFVGDETTLVSFSYRVQVDCEAGPLAADFNRVGMLVVLDRKPQGPDPNISQATPDLGTLMSPPPAGSTLVRQYLNYKNVETTDAGDQPEPRYEILRHHKAIVQPQAAGATRFGNAIFTGTIKSQYKFIYPQRAAPNAGERLPLNKRILIFCYSDSEIFPAPVFTGYCRYRYRDQ